MEILSENISNITQAASLGLIIAGILFSILGALDGLSFVLPIGVIAALIGVGIYFFAPSYIIEDLDVTIHDIESVYGQGYRVINNKGEVSSIRRSYWE